MLRRNMDQFIKMDENEAMQATSPSLLSPPPPTQQDAASDTSPRYPDLSDLLERLHFSTHDGRIWLDDQRMLLVQAKALGALRREMIRNLGVDVARGLLTRMGFHAGAHDAKMARRLRGSMSAQDAFVVGPQLHCLEGIGYSELVQLDFDIERGHHYGEFIWSSPLEDEEHARFFPLGSEPACWMQIGYASGFSSEFMGQPVLYREVECQSMGHGTCRIIGKPVAQWGGEADGDLRFIMPDWYTAGPQTAEALPKPAPATLPPASSPKPEGPIGASLALSAVLNVLTRAAPSKAPVLLLGESGCGKTRLAQHLHRLSGRQGPLVSVHAAAAGPAELGHAHDCATATPGLLARAQGGTLLVEGIEALPPAAQAHLVAWLESSLSAGADQPRLVVTSNRDLRGEMEAGRLREDLYYRLNVFPLRIPPLRERREDIAPLLTHFLSQHADGSQATRSFTTRAIDALLSYNWPGNVRELENMIARALILAPEDDLIDVGHLFCGGERMGEARYRLDATGKLVELATDFAKLGAENEAETEAGRMSRQVSAMLLNDEVPGEDDGIELDELEGALLRRAVERAEGNVSAAARLLGITRAQMVYRLKSRGITT